MKDLHYSHAEMGLGHEGVGIVEAVGPDAKVLKAGDRVGWGYCHDACGHCQECLEGFNTFCSQRQMYGYANLDQGSFADGAVWRESYLFKLPDNIKDEDAAPLVSRIKLHRRTAANLSNVVERPSSRPCKT